MRKLLIVIGVSVSALSLGQSPEKTAPVVPLDKVAVLPVIFQDGTDTAIKTAQETFDALLAAALCEPLKQEEVMNVWLRDLRLKDYETRIPARKYLPDLPSPKNMLALGQRLGVRFVVAARVKWQTTSKWVALGPKTKAYCSADVVVVDVPNKEVDVEELGVLADSTKAEKNWETAASLFVSMGFTALSGGPKTPHQERAAQLALSGAMVDWIKDRRRSLEIPRKITD